MIGVTLMQEEYLENSIALASKVEDEFAKIGKKVRDGERKASTLYGLHKRICLEF
jgi:N-acetylmuramoyl-L-alanine amidase